MNLKINFKKQDDLGNEKEISKTFSNLNDSASNENLVTFAEAFLSLTDIEDYSLQKITVEDLM